MPAGGQHLPLKQDITGSSRPSHPGVPPGPFPAHLKGPTDRQSHQELLKLFIWNKDGGSKAGREGTGGWAGVQSRPRSQGLSLSCRMEGGGPLP